MPAMNTPKIVLPVEVAQDILRKAQNNSTIQALSRAPRRSSRTSRTQCSPRSPRPSRLAARGGASAVDAGVSVHRWQSDDLNENQKLTLEELEQCLICISRCHGIVKWLFLTGSACPQRGDEVSLLLCVAKRGFGPHLHGASWLLSGQTKILNRHRRTLSPGRMSCARSFLLRRIRRR